MVTLVEIEYYGAKYKIPKRDDVNEWKFWISVWLNEGCRPSQVQESINKHVELDTIKMREDLIKNLFNEDSNYNS